MSETKTTEKRGNDLNTIILTGRITQKEDLRKTTSGREVINFSIANQDYNASETSFFRCTAWGPTAKFIAQYVEKGQAVVVNGAMHMSTFTDKDGNKRQSYTVNVAQLTVAPRSNGAAKKAETNPAADAEFEEIVDDDEDLPF